VNALICGKTDLAVLMQWLTSATEAPVLRRGFFFYN
jgi:hypothetical protein